MANYWDQFVTGLGMQNSPYGFAPSPPGMVQGNPAQGVRMQFIGDMGARMLANSGRNPMEAFGQAYSGAQEASLERSKHNALAQKMLAEAEENRRKRDEENQRKAQLDQYISTLPTEQQALARMFPEKFVGAQIDQQFAPPGGGTEAGLNLTYWTDANGTLHAGQMLKSGGIKEVPLPEGGKWAPGVGMLDTGTGYVQYDKRTGTLSGDVVQKNLREAESLKEQGQVEGQAKAGAPGDIAAADLALGKINELRSDPNRAMGTGASSVFNRIPATPGYDFQTKVDEVTSGAFLTAIQQMRGLGQLSNAEGQTAKAAVTRMNTATSEQEFLDALNDYEEVVMKGRERAVRRLNGEQPTQETAPKTRYKFNPETGELE